MENIQTEIIEETIPTGTFEDFMEAAPIMDDDTTYEEGPSMEGGMEEDLINEINQPKDPMGISMEPDDDSLQAKDLLDDEAFKFSGEMLSFGIDIGAAYLLAWIAHQPLETYRLQPKDLKKLEKVISKCASSTKLMLSPWQGLFVVLIAIYGMKIPQVIQARKDWENQQKLLPHDINKQNTSIPFREDSGKPTNSEANTDGTATASTGDSTRANNQAESDSEDTD